MGAIAKLVTIPSYTKIPAGSITRGMPDALRFRLITDEEREYMQMVWAANSRLRMDYLELREKAEAIRQSAEEKAESKNP